MARKVTPERVISTFAGNGTAAFSGDGGPATQASIQTPAGLASDPNGNLFIAGERNFRLRKVARTPMPSRFRCPTSPPAS